MTLSELGATLQGEREKRGLTLQDVAERLRISTHVLGALEMGDMDALPHKAYAKGFIRSYATLLGLATDEIEACVASLSGASPSVPQPIATMEDNGAEPTVPTGKLLACAVVLLLLAGGGYAVWQANLLELMPSMEQIRTAIPITADKGKTPAEKDTEPAPSGTTTDSRQATPKQVAAGKPVPEQAVPGKTDSGKTPPRQGAPEQSGASKPASAQTAAPNKPVTNQPAPNQSVATAPATAQSAPAAPSAQPASLPRHHKIIVTATEDCWIHSNADKTNTRQFTLRKGDTFALTFAKSLEVKLGNAAGVRIRYNGNELPPAGKSGETRTLVFPPASQQ